MKYPTQAQELVNLLLSDQAEWKAYAKAENIDKVSELQLRNHKIDLRKKVTKRWSRALQILNEIKGLPSLENIGSEAAIALSVLATHHSLDATKHVLAAFEACYELSPENTQVTCIPTMTDWIAVLEQRPQKFGTIWLFDRSRYPFLPTVEDFKTINSRRATYGLEPLRWPRSLALPEEDQPWLKRPLTEAIMRAPTKDERESLAAFF